MTYFDEEQEDDLFCEHLYQEFLNSDKGDRELIPLDDAITTLELDN